MNLTSLAIGPWAITVMCCGWVTSFAELIVARIFNFFLGPTFALLQRLATARRAPRHWRSSYCWRIWSAWAALGRAAASGAMARRNGAASKRASRASSTLLVAAGRAAQASLNVPRASSFAAVSLSGASALRGDSRPVCARHALHNRHSSGSCSNVCSLGVHSDVR